jgi:hypothetical protein
VVYEPHDHIRNARCIGHGGVPVYAERGLKPPARWRLEKSFKSGIEEWAYMGYAVLDFEGPKIHVSYRDEFGGENYTETIE